MSTNSSQILQAALALPPQERAELVDQILASFVAPPDQTILDKWAEEVESRIDAIESDEMETISAEDAFAKLRGRRKQ